MSRPGFASIIFISFFYQLFLKYNGKRRAFSFPAVHGDMGSVIGRAMLYYRQAETRASYLSGVAFVNPVKPLKNPVKMFLWYTYACVGNLYNFFAVFLAGEYGDLSAGLIILHGVFAEVVYYLVYHRRHSVYYGAFSGDFNSHLVFCRELAKSQRHAFRLLGNSCRGAGGITVIIMENNIWRGFTKEEQELCHRMKERDSQVENYLSGTIQAGYEIVLERMESSLAIICKLLKEGKEKDARQLFETVFRYYNKKKLDLRLEVEFLKRALPLVAQIRSRKDTLYWVWDIIEIDIAILEKILRKRYWVFEEVDQHQERRER